MCRYDVEAAYALCVCLLANAFVLLCQDMMQLSAIQHAHEHTYTSSLDGFNVHVNQQHNAAEERTAFRHPADSVDQQAKPVWFRAAQDWPEPFHDKSHGRVRRPRNLNPDRLAAKAPIFHLQMQPTSTLRPRLRPSNPHQTSSPWACVESRTDRHQRHAASGRHVHQGAAAAPASRY
ncbi:hypothetical protein N5P37_007316 [Trichoderma harzianum]|uniref:Uncharacterized protein n=1 Tax=Trichoderma harzianum CBS 226.95 TaxID=983964 RepID=A0A2T4AKY1_TRIHA|nr:hypothetical protein M431DRAFT_347825 [Trichoderma harzianum CBS 226.95]KAK0760234.1 hypothetical protein N5P37_007316 [Trichoderma harzianum]PTB57682.1 hypothetical protein M431DRAFT_347825 [Trichoderma harzianum CBS 226.95]